MPERTFGAESRYGFQGQEDDVDITSSAIAYRFRISDSRLGRFFSEDPIAEQYPANSPYAFAENRVLDGVELEGLEWKPVKDNNGEVSDYKWLGYDSKGNPAAGTVANGTIVKGDFLLTFGSDKKTKSGSLEITSLTNEVRNNGWWKDITPLYNYSIKIKQGIDFTDFSVTMWNLEYKSGLLIEERIDLEEPVKDHLFYRPTILNRGQTGSQLLGMMSRLLGSTAPSTSISPVYPELLFIPVPKGLRILSAESKAATGGMKQWLRFGKSFSKTGQTPSIGFRWGAGGDFSKKIGNSFLRSANEWLRKRRLIPGLKTWWNEPGHFHIMKLPSKEFYWDMNLEIIKRMK